MDAIFTATPEMLAAVAEWRQRRRDEQYHRALVPSLRQRFPNLTNATAVEVIRLANAGGTDAGTS
jgi:hypothetical protein